MSQKLEHILWQPAFIYLIIDIGLNHLLKDIFAIKICGSIRKLQSQIMNRSVIFRFLLLLLLGCPGCLFAQRIDHPLEWINADETLSNSTVRAIVQDNLGFMWFGTSNGLFRYDGYNILHFKHEPGKENSLSSSLINALIIDHTGAIWIGTQNGGLDKLDMETLVFTHYKHDPQNTNSLATNSINSLLEDNKGTLWVALRHGGIDQFNPELKTFLHYKHNDLDPKSISNDEVAALYNDENKRLWAGTWFGGLNCMSLSEQQGIHQNKTFPINFGKDASNNAAIAFGKLKNGDLLIGTQYNGLYVIRGNQDIVRAETLYSWAKAISKFSILYIKESSDGILYLGTTEGLALVNLKDQSIKLYTNKYNLQGSGLKDNEIYSLFEDHTGVIWIGTKKGLNKLVPKRFEQYKTDANNNELTRNNVLSFVEKDPETIWIGTWGSGIFQYHLKSNQSIETFSGNKDQKYGNYIWSLYKDQQNTIWIGTNDKGFYSYNLLTNKFKFYNDLPGLNNLQVTCFYEDIHHNFWIGTWEGLLKFNRQTNQCVWFKNSPGDSNSLSNNFVTAINGNQSGEIWIGTRYEGLNKLILQPDHTTYQFTSYQSLDNKQDAINNNYISSLFVDAHNELWIGTEGGGLNKYISKSNNFSSITEAQGLPNNYIQGISEDKKGNIWISTNNGLAVLKNDSVVTATYSQSDGLQNNSFNPNACYFTSSGFFLFGGANGFNYFNPDNITINTKLVNTIITDFKVFNKSFKPFEKADDGNMFLKKSIEYTRDITLTYRNNNFSFEFSALDFANPENNNYTYQLTGFDKDWITTTAKRRFATYTNLNPGNYKFVVKGTNGQGYWNQSATIINVTVKPPFWKTIWALLIYATSLMLLLLLIRKIALDRANLRHSIELANLERDKDNEINQIKVNFFTNISHEFRTPLTLIIAPLEEMLSKRSMIKDDIGDKINIMYKNANRLLRLIDQLMDFRKAETKKLTLEIEHTDIIAYLTDVADDFYSLGIQYNKHFNVSSESESFYGWIDKEKVEKIVFNLLSNAFKYTQPGGNITLNIRIHHTDSIPGHLLNNSTGNYLNLKVIDTGIGIKENELEKIFEPFYRSDHQKMNHQTGTGIGLSLVKEFITLHNGTIKVESVVDHGSCFTVELPLDKESYSSEHFLEEKLIDVQFSKFDDGVPEREVNDLQVAGKQDILLIIEDNDDVRNYLRDSFKANYRIVQAHDGKEGIQMAFKYIPDLIICDIMMPEMNGVEATTHLKSDIRTSHIPVIMLTARTSMEHQLEGLEVGADSYITKPFNIRHLETSVRKLIETRKKLRERFSNDISINPSDLKVSSMDETFLQKAIDLTYKHLDDENFSIEQFGSEIFLSRSQLHRKITALTNQTPSEFVRTIRLKRAAQLLIANKLTIAEIAYQTGFNSPAYFTKCFKAYFAMVPTDYILKHGGSKTIED